LPERHTLYTRGNQRRHSSQSCFEYQRSFSAFISFYLNYTYYLLDIFIIIKTASRQISAHGKADKQGKSVTC